MHLYNGRVQVLETLCNYAAWPGVKDFSCREHPDGHALGLGVPHGRGGGEGPHLRGNTRIAYAFVPSHQGGH